MRISHNRYVADISANNRVFDADQYHAAGHVLIGIKATEGLHYVNPNHRGWCYAAGGKHIGILHYHFARPDLGNDPRAEADMFLSWAYKLAGGRDYLVLDLERATPAGWSHDPAWSRGFDEHVQAHTRFHTILYANRSTLEQSDQWLTGDRRRVWDADWSSGPSYAPPGYTCVLRQFTDGVVGPEPHALAGVGQCDISLASASLFADALAELP